MTENTIKNYQAIIINFFKKNYKIILSICIFLIIIFAVLQFYLWNKNNNILELSLKYEEALSIDKSSIEFKEKLTSEFTVEWQDVVNLTGLPTTPTIKYKGEYFLPGRDYGNPQQLINLLEAFKPSKYDDSRKTLERIKTLNFNINTAFNRLDQLLRKIETKINTDEHKSTD